MDKIICYKCNTLKFKTEFPRDKTQRRGYYGYCKKCKYELNKERKYWLDAEVKKKVLKRRRDLKLMAIKYKGGKCVDCGYNKHPAALCFHHLEDKLFSINHLLKFSFKKAKSELDKCVLLCHNCHDIRHYGKWKGHGHKK